METADSFKPGKYVHYKGGEYVAICLAHHHETRELMVVYISVGHGWMNVREYSTSGADSWTDTVVLADGGSAPRFRYVGPAVDR